MSKTLIHGFLRERIEMNAKQATDITNDLLELFARELKKQGRLVLPTFGTLRTAKRKARKGMNPRTGERIRIKAKKTVRFKPSPKLQEKM